MFACVINGSPGLLGINIFFPPINFTNLFTELGFPYPTLKT